MCWFPEYKIAYHLLARTGPVFLTSLISCVLPEGTQPCFSLFFSVFVLVGFFLSVLFFFFLNFVRGFLLDWFLVVLFCFFSNSFNSSYPCRGFSVLFPASSRFVFISVSFLSHTYSIIKALLGMIFALPSPFICR